MIHVNATCSNGGSLYCQPEIPEKAFKHDYVPTSVGLVNKQAPSQLCSSVYTMCDAIPVYINLPIHQSVCPSVPIHPSFGHAMARCELVDLLFLNNRENVAKNSRAKLVATAHVQSGWLLAGAFAEKLPAPVIPRRKVKLFTFHYA